MSLFDSSSLVPPIALVSFVEFGREGFEHYLCSCHCIWCIGLSSLWRIWFELLIGACPSWVLGTLDVFVALVALWPWWHLLRPFVAFVGSLQLSCGEVPQPCERFRLPPTSAPIVEAWIDPIGVRFTGESGRPFVALVV